MGKAVLAILVAVVMAFVPLLAGCRKPLTSEQEAVVTRACAEAGLSVRTHYEHIECFAYMGR